MSRRGEEEWGGALCCDQVIRFTSCQTLFCKVLSDFRRNLAIRHLVHGFNTHDASAQVVFFKTFFQLALCLTRTEYQNRLRVTNTRNDRIEVNVEMCRKGSSVG